MFGGGRRVGGGCVRGVVHQDVFGGVHVGVAGQVDVPGWQFVFAACTQIVAAFVVGVVPAGADFLVGALLAVGPVVFVALVLNGGCGCGD